MYNPRSRDDCPTSAEIQAAFNDPDMSIQEAARIRKHIEGGYEDCNQAYYEIDSQWPPFGQKRS